VNLAALFGGIGRALSHPIYRTYWAGQGINSVGRWMYRTSIGWLTWQLTESTSWLGIVAFADAIPLVAFTLVAGAITDQFGYFRIMRAVSLTATVLAAIFAALIVFGHITIWWVLALTLLLGSCEAITYPARVSVVNVLVPRADLAPAIALGSTTFNGARIIGPGIAGALILALGEGPVIGISAATYLIFSITLLMIHPEEPPRPNKRLDVIGDTIAGFKYLRTEPGVGFLLVLVGALGLFVRPFIDQLPGYSAQIFHRGPDGLAILLSAIGIGAMCAGFWVAQRGRIAGLTSLVTFSAMAMGASVMLFCVFDYVWVAAAFLALAGFFMLCSNVCSQTLIQNAIDPRMRGRVIGLFIVISWGLPALGTLTMGWVASVLGLKPAIAGGGALAVALWLWSRRISPKVAPHLERTEIEHAANAKRAAE
jgi:MFS family permease